MQIKLFEVLDEGTAIPIIAVRLGPTCEAERYLAARAGYGRDPTSQRKYVLVCDLQGGTMTSDPFKHTDGGRTLRQAHLYLDSHFDELESGAVIDVEFILGKSQAPKPSEAAYTAQHLANLPASFQRAI